MIRNEIGIFKAVVEAVVHEITVDSIVIDGVYSTVYTCNTLYLNIGKRITIGATKYKVTEFVINESFTLKAVKGTSTIDPALTSITIPNPIFYDGTPRRIQAENLNDKKVPDYQSPIICLVSLVRIKPPEDKFTSYVTSTIEGANIFFLDDCDYADWNQEDHRINIWQPMENELNHIFRALEARTDIFDRNIQKPERIFHSNFGTYLTNKGYENTIFTGAWSGVQAIFDIPYVIEPCECDEVIICAPSRFLLDGVTVETLTAGSDLNVLVKNQLGNTPEYSYDDETNILEVQTGGDCDPVSVTFNTVPVTSTPAGETKAVEIVSSLDNPVGDVIVDDAGTLKGQIANSTIQNAAAPTWTDTVESEQPYTLDPQPYTDSNGDSLTQNYDPAVPIICTPCVALPTAGLNIPLSFTGANLVNYTSHVPFTSPNVYNNIARGASGGTSFNMNIFSIETMTGGEDWVIEGDNLYLPTASYFWGFGLQSNTGINYVDIDFCFFVTTSGVIQWIESGVNTGTVTTTTNAYWSWRLEYSGTTKEIKLYINGNLVKTKVTTYVAQTLVVKACGRNANQNIANHVNLRKVASSNRILVPIGDSITANDPNSNFPGRSYVEKMIAFSNHKFFVNPVLAIPGSTTANVIATQLPLAAIHYNASYTSNVFDVMIGINDLRTSVPLATIQANLQTIISYLKNIGPLSYVRMHTILRDFSTDWPNRYLLNADILANVYGADQIIDHTTSVLESDSSYFTNNISPIGLHPNANGTTQIAIESYPGLLTAP